MKYKNNFRSVLLIVLVAIISFVLVKVIFLSEYNRVSLANRYIFTEKSGYTFTLSEDEKVRLREYLSVYYFEDNDYAGFGINRQTQPDIFRRLYFNHCLAMLTGLDNDQTYRQLFNHVFIRVEGLIDVWELPAYEHFYYYCLKQLNGIPVDNREIMMKLERSTDSESGLLFYRLPDDDISVKLLLTAKVMRLAEKFDFNLDDLGYKSAIDRQFSNHSFQPPEKGQTFFASGGGLIYAAGYLPGSDTDSKAHDEWFRRWYDLYTQQRVNDMQSLIDHSSFKVVAEIFGVEHSSEITEYLKALSSLDLDDHLGEGQSCEVLHDYVFSPGNDLISREIRERAQEIVLHELRTVETEVTTHDLINIGDTYYGAELAYLCDFDWNTSKTLRTVQEIHNAAFQLGSDREFIYNTYYYLLLLTSFDSELLSPFDTYALINRISPRDSTSFLNRLDKIIGQLLINIEQTDVTKLRVALEIKSNIDSPISRRHLKKTADLVNHYAKEPVYTVKGIDIFKIDHLTKLNILTQNQFDTLEQELADSGGYCASAGDPADLVTTFRIYSMTSNHELFRPDEKRVRDMKSFLNQLQKDGLYRYHSDHNLVDFRSVVYGYMLRDFNGGHIDD